MLKSVDILFLDIFDSFQVKKQLHNTDILLGDKYAF